MTTSIFPSLAGINFPVRREEEWRSQVVEAGSGKETQIGYWSSPRWRWELGVDFLRLTTAAPEFKQLAGFFGQMGGRSGRFLYQDADDQRTTGASISTAGSTSAVSFDLVRRFGTTVYSFTERIWAPATGSTYQVYVNGTSVSSTFASLRGYDTTAPGTILFTSAPGAFPIVADYSFYFPCRFEDDSMTFEKFNGLLYRPGSVPFRSLK